MDYIAVACKPATLLSDWVFGWSSVHPQRKSHHTWHTSCRGVVWSGDLTSVVLSSRGPEREAAGRQVDHKKTH